MKYFIPYEPYQLQWHLVNNCFNALSDAAIDGIIQICMKVNAGEMELTEQITEDMTVEQMLSDLKIDVEQA
jgi:hypothetical protein